MNKWQSPTSIKLKNGKRMYFRLYSIWRGMKIRCYSKKNKDYEKYGGRGILMSLGWYESYDEFYEWSVNNGYKENLSIDRKENSKGYTPNNCRWVDKWTQTNNRDITLTMTYQGMTRNLYWWSDQIGVSYDTLVKRKQRYKWCDAKCIETPLHKGSTW